MNKYPEYHLVQKCLQLIEKKLNWGSSKSWHNNVFIELSDKIQEQTQVLLSPTTLKRVWGKVNYKNAPSISTLNTLAQFSGFLNWRDFKNKAAAKKPSFIARVISLNTGIIIASAAIMTLVFISFYSLVGKDEIIEKDYSKIKFKSRPIAEGLPNSVIFDFDLTGLTSDSIYIQQFWDVTKTIKINKKQTQATGQYYYPGYFRAKLLVDGKIIKEHDLFIKTKGWVGTIDYKPIPKYISKQDILLDNLSFSNSILEEIKSSEISLISSFHYINDLKTISGDNFTLTTSIKNNYRDKWAVCQQSAIVIVGTKSAFVIPFSIPGCVSELNMMLSDTFLSGKKHDLSFLGTDLSTFRDIKILVENKNITIAINNNNVFSKNISKSIGNIVGIRFRFLGTGEVDYLNIIDNNSQQSFNEDFKL